MSCFSLYSPRTLSQHTANEILVTLNTVPLPFMMHLDFWGLKHYSDQSFSNKCNCDKQVDWINAKVVVTLPRSHPLDPWTFLLRTLSLYHLRRRVTQFSAVGLQTISLKMLDLNSLSPIAFLHCSNVGNITQSNNGRTRLTQKTNRKSITWRHYIVLLRQYLPPTLLLLKGYRKFVLRIQPRCWVLQIAILEKWT